MTFTRPAPRPAASAQTPIGRHRLLAGLTRSRILAELRASDAPLGIRAIAELVGLHQNSVRDQLIPLIDAGLVVRERSTPVGRGRPALRYAAHSDIDDPEPYRDLAHVLAAQMARQPEPAREAVEAGSGWGRSLVQPSEHAPDATDARARLVALLADAGFAPESGSPPDSGSPAAATAPIRLRRCPFEPLARVHRSVVCGVHLGLMRGALDELGAPLDAMSLEPYVEPDLCVAHLRQRAEPGPDSDG